MIGRSSWGRVWRDGGVCKATTRVRKPPSSGVNVGRLGICGGSIQRKHVQGSSGSGLPRYAQWRVVLTKLENVDCGAAGGEQTNARVSVDPLVAMCALPTE